MLHIVLMRLVNIQFVICAIKLKYVIPNTGHTTLSFSLFVHVIHGRT